MMDDDSGCEEFKTIQFKCAKMSSGPKSVSFSSGHLNKPSSLLEDLRLCARIDGLTEEVLPRDRRSPRAD